MQLHNPDKKHLQHIYDSLFSYNGTAKITSLYEFYFYFYIISPISFHNLYFPK